MKRFLLIFMGILLLNITGCGSSQNSDEKGTPLLEDTATPNIEDNITTNHENNQTVVKDNTPSVDNSKDSDSEDNPQTVVKDNTPSVDDSKDSDDEDNPQTVVKDNTPSVDNSKNSDTNESSIETVAPISDNENNQTEIKDNNISTDNSNESDADEESSLYLEDNFVRRNQTSDDIQTIWNMPLKTFNLEEVQKFDIGVNITKYTPLTTGNILIKGIEIKNNKIINIESLSIFGKKSTGSTGSILYESDFNITKNSIKIEKDILEIQLGYIIENQTIVSKNSFKKEANYDIDIYMSKLDIHANPIDEEYLLRIEFNSFHKFVENSQKISGLVVIK